MKYTKQNNNFLHPLRSTLYAARGFTLIEMLISLAIFSFVMLATTSVLLTVIDANHKSHSLKISIDNLSVAFESMTRNLRTGYSYYEVNPDIASCQGTGSDSIAFFNHLGTQTYYRLNAGALEISKDGDGDIFTAITAPEITIERLCFYVSGTSVEDGLQPTVLIVLGGVVNSSTSAGAKAKTTSRFDLETMVTQRIQGS